MTLEDMQDVLQRLVALADGWKTTGVVPPIERDLALDKLRQLYEALLWVEAASGSSVPPVGEDVTGAVSISLDEVLSIESVSDSVGTEAGGEAVPPAGAEVVQTASAPDAPPTGGETTLEVVSSSGVAEPAEPASGETCAPLAETPQQTPSQPVFPTLFGLEETEETRRRRHKQQVLMSLYDDEPRGTGRMAAEPEPMPVQCEAPSAEPAGLRDEMPEEEERLFPTETPEPAAPGQAAAPADRVAGAMEASLPVTEPDSFAEEGDGIVIEEIELPSCELPAAASEPAAQEDATESEGEQLSDPEAEKEPLSGRNTILGEVINHDVQTLADTLATPRDRASDIARSEPVADLRQAIGLNDKFLLIRDLFDGDGTAYDRAVEALNECADLDDCMIYIAEHYAWNPHSDGSKRMMELLERKYS